jgi:ribosomal protein S18 acetylase RimI-like enzyme
MREDLMIEVREITPNEYGFLREMLYEAIYLLVGSDKLPFSVVDEPSLSMYVEDFGRIGDIGYVLVDKTELVGAIWSRLFTEDRAGYGFVDAGTPEFSIAIKSHLRNRGFGNLMIQKLLERLKSEGFEKLSLSVDKRNLAVTLYKRLGFEVFAESVTAYTMLKNL